MKTIHQTWEGCYDRQWGDYITSASFAHPAKMARGLLERIIQHGFERGWWKKGDTIADCFGGVGTTGIIGAYHGLKVFSVELEKKFVSLARRNYALHASKWKMLGCQRPVMLQGDSRQFDKLIGEAVGVVSSPPFTQGYSSGGGINVKGYGPDGKDKVGSRTYQGTGGDRSPGKIETLPCGSVAACVSSPPYAGLGEVLGSNNGIDFAKAKEGGKRRTEARAAAGQQYGKTDGQIASLPCGSVAACVSSPPYSDQELSGTRRALDEYDRSGHHAAREYGKESGQIGRLAPGDIAAVLSSPPFQDSMSDKPSEQILSGSGGRMGRSCKGNNYGETTGQIGRLKGGSVQGVVSSPPYATEVIHGGHGLKLEKFKDPKRVGVTSHAIGKNEMQRYGETPGNIGNDKETYWSACREVYAAVYRTIKPGGVMILVTKDFVRNRQRVPLSDDTVTLCESLGFVLIERIRAMLVSQTTHGDLFNGSDVKTKSRKSFFRRLAEGKGSPRIDWEDVLVFRRP